MFGKTAKKAKLLNDYVKIVPKNCSPNFCEKVATNLTAQICFKSSLDCVNNFSEKFFCSNFSKVTAKKTKLFKFLGKMLPKKLYGTKFCRAWRVGASLPTHQASTY